MAGKTEFKSQAAYERHTDRKETIKQYFRVGTMDFAQAKEELVKLGYGDRRAEQLLEKWRDGSAWLQQRTKYRSPEHYINRVRESLAAHDTVAALAYTATQAIAKVESIGQRPGFLRECFRQGVTHDVAVKMVVDMLVKEHTDHHQ